MKTLVEFFDLDSMKNIASACCYNPKKLVFVCEKAKVTNLQKQAIYNLIILRELQCEVCFFEVSKTDIGKIQNVLKNISKSFEDVVFDLTGGRELMLICAGIFCKENNVPAFYLDLVRGQFINVIACERYEKSFVLPKFNVNQILKIYGATCKRSGHCTKKLTVNDFSEILEIFDVFKLNTIKWPGFVKYLQSVRTQDEADCTFLGQKAGDGYTAILERLLSAGVIYDLRFKQKSTSFIYKNVVIKNWLKIQGVWLELFTYIAAIKSNYFDDVQMSVIMQWDSEKYNIGVAQNEIDVILVKGARPVFISCKTSIPNTFALNEIRLLSTKFGGSLSKTVMVTSKNISKEHNNIYQRAIMLKICVAEYEDLHMEQLSKMLEDITTGMYKYK